MELQFKNLFDQVTSLNSHYKHIAELTGENFNTFRILKLESSEVRLHSAFLAELLNPSGSHGQKNTFLNLFLERFCFKGNGINPNSCNVHVEKHIAFRNLNGTEGGRIDLMIEDNNHNRLIIENKIYAGDQSLQMLRYYNYDPNADLLYLTLYGKEPTEYSKLILEIGKHYKCISYKTDILDWLEQCRKEVATNPIVRESLTQYINLIKYLTNQTINNSMAKELHSLIKSNLETAFLVTDNLDNALDEVFEVFVNELQQVCEKFNLRLINGVDFEKNYSGLWISKIEWKHVNIAFQFGKEDKDFVYGIIAKSNPDTFNKSLRSKLNSLPNNSTKPNKWYPWINYFEEPYKDWSKYSAWKAIMDGSMLKVIEEKIIMLLNLTADIDSLL